MTLVERLREEANVTIHNIDEQEIACSPRWAMGVLEELAKLMNEAADALAALRDCDVCGARFYSGELCEECGLTLAATSPTHLNRSANDSAPLGH